jgi:hypothetical protein
MMRRLVSCLLVLVICVEGPAIGADEPGSKPIRVLFLGDEGHHRPSERFTNLWPVLEQRGISMTYTDRVSAISPATLLDFDVLLLYANHLRLPPEAEEALLAFVREGHGFVPLHCASACFGNSREFVDLVGARFDRHGTGVIGTRIESPDHPIMAGFGGFTSWDETYVHADHNEQGRTVLEVREDGKEREPWTWVRTEGKGRVFYTAWGHDERTWSHPGFHSLVERGIRWAAGRDLSSLPPFSDRPEFTPPRSDVAPFKYVEANVPFYPAGERWGTIGEPFRRMQSPLSADESARHFSTPRDFEVRLFAAEPDIGKPLAMNWDARGRLWLTETVDYPNERAEEGQGRDRIRICEDTDGDGRADRFTVFADKLSIPTSLAFSNGGVIVHQAPDTLFLKDTDGDDVADLRQIVLHGWSTDDTHAGPSNIRYGLDNWFYGMVGYAGFAGEVAGEEVRFRTGFYRFLPDGKKLEFLRNTDNNSWGVGFSEEGDLFGSTANGNPSVHLPIPNRVYEAVRGWSSRVLPTIAESARFHPITDKVRQVDHHGNFSAAAGHALYTARAYPFEFWNRAAFVTGPEGHLVSTFLIQPLGGTYLSRYEWNLAASDDEWTAPIAAEVGPDGQVWLIDWYNYIVQHNPTPAGYQTGRGNAYETDLRDKTHGRIYRVVYTKRQPEPSPALSLDDPRSLLAALDHSNMFWRLHAQRLLVERGETDVVGELVNRTADPTVDEVGLNVGVIHALAVLHGLEVLDGSNPVAAASAAACLDHASSGVRRNAAAFLPRNAAAEQVLIDSGVLDDPVAQVRLAALLALAEMPASSRGANAAARALGDRRVLDDRNLTDAATAAAAAHAGEFLRIVSAPNPGLPEAPAAMGAVRIVAEHWARGGPADQAALLVTRLADGRADVAEAVVDGLARGWPRERPAELDQAAERALTSLVDRLPGASKGRLIRVAGLWGSDALADQAGTIAEAFQALVADAGATSRERIQAARDWMEFVPVDPEAARSLLGLVGPRLEPELARGIFDALAQSQSPGLGSEVLGLWPTLTPAMHPSAVRLLLSRGEWSRSLVEGLEAGTILPGDLSLDQRQALAVHPDLALAERARAVMARGGGLPNPDRQKVLAELLPLAERKGDATLGKQVFVKECAKCHTHSGEGTRIGPDLTGMAVHPKAELLTQLLDPSRSVEGNFRAYTIVTEDGLTVTGLLASESRTSMEIFDSEGKRQVLQREDVAEVVVSPKSLMPEGFEKQVTADDIVNLLEFLTQRGKYLPLSLDKVATVVSTKGMFYGEEATAERLIFDDWSPKTVEQVPFQLVDPRGDRVANVILLYGPQGRIPPRMPKEVRLPLNAPAKAIHFLSGVSGWGYPLGSEGSVTMIVRLHYEGGEVEDHPLKNGEHFADYIRRVDVPGSKFAFNLRGRQLRYLAVQPSRAEAIKEIELVKGEDETAPVVVAITMEAP